MASYVITLMEDVMHINIIIIITIIIINNKK